MIDQILTYLKLIFLIVLLNFILLQIFGWIIILIMNRQYILSMILNIYFIFNKFFCYYTICTCFQFKKILNNKSMSQSNSAESSIKQCTKKSEQNQKGITLQKQQNKQIDDADHKQKDSNFTREQKQSEKKKESQTKKIQCDHQKVKEIKKQKNKQQVDYDEEIPQKFYDSDLASVNQKDFLSDNEPPKDIVYERKLLHKQKKLHIYKTIVRVGKGIDKPAPYDQIILRFKDQPVTDKQGVQQARKLQFINGSEFETYNLGKKHENIERLVTSMKQNEVAMFEVEQLQVSKKTNIKVLKHKTIYVIQVSKWITVVDIDGNKQVLKYLLRRGEGPHRVSKYDQVTVRYSISCKGVEIVNEHHKLLKLEQNVIDKMQPTIWKILSTMKRNELVQVKLSDYNMQALSALWQKVDKKQKEPSKKTTIKNNDTQQNGQQMQQDQKQQSEYTANLCRYDQLYKLYQQKNQSELKQMEMKEQKIETKQQQQTDGEELREMQSKKQIKIQQNQWIIDMQVIDLISIDDIYMNGKVLKKLLVKGVSTAKPQSSSLIYYALKFLDSNKKVLHEDACFNSDWWEDFGKLDLLGCRKNYMDQYKISKFLKACMKRMKPAEISEIQCRDKQLFQYGHDFQQLKELWKEGEEFPPQAVYMIVRVYNFTEGKICFNMHISQKIQESKRRKLAAVRLLNDGNYKKAFKRFQNIVSFYGSGDITQDAYDEKISALMNSILCLMKQNKYAEMIPLCNIVLQRPKHGFNQDKMKIKAQGIKVQGNVKNADGEEMDSRQAADLEQNPKILDKCLYRKGLALLKTGQSQHSIQCLDKIGDQSQEVRKLRAEAEKHLQNYQEKSKKLFKNMFG